MKTLQELVNELQSILDTYPGLAHTPVWLNVRTDEVESGIESIDFDESQVMMKTPDTFDD